VALLFGLFTVLPNWFRVVFCRICHETNVWLSSMCATVVRTTSDENHSPHAFREEVCTGITYCPHVTIVVLCKVSWARHGVEPFLETGNCLALTVS